MVGAEFELLMKSECEEREREKIKEQGVRSKSKKSHKNRLKY